MQDISRREALAGLAGASLFTASFSMAGERQPAAKIDLSADQKRVMEAGLSRSEAECWKFAAETAKAFFDLPVQHSMDAQEVASAIHVLQNSLLARPASREVLERQPAKIQEPLLPPSSRTELTKQESLCFMHLEKTAELFQALPLVHPDARYEIGGALRTVQNKLLGRPTYRKYLKGEK